ncbi:MAG: hypothetical protein WC211_00050 [Dehalococcoidia bacterium]
MPAASSFALKDQVKSVITVVAKTHHYWVEHVLMQEMLAATAARSRP